MMRPATSAPLLIATLVLAAWSAAAASPPAVAGSPVRGEPVTVTLETLWSRGGDDDPEVMFGIPVGVAADHAGNVYVLDNQLCQIVALTPDGQLREYLGREGEGPGEFRRPNGLIVLPDGAIAAARMIQARFERLTPTGIPDGTITLGRDEPQGSAVVLYGAACRGGSLLAATATSSFDQSTGQMDRVQNLDLHHPDGRLRARLREARFVMDFTGKGRIREHDLMRCFLLVHAVGPQGRVYVPRSRDEYLIDVYGPDGKLQRTVGRPGYQAPPRTDRERARLEALADSWSRNAGVDVPLDYADCEMAVQSLMVDDRGHLLVRHAASGRDLPRGVFLRLDEFAPDGRYLGEVRVRADADPMMDTLAWLGDGRVAITRGGVLTGLERWRDAAVYWEGEDEVVPEVVVCRWSR
jgi:hypothetical protein